MTPTINDAREPTSTRAKMSRPIWSVPSQCAPEGPAEYDGESESGSTIHGDTMRDDADRDEHHQAGHRTAVGAEAPRHAPAAGLETLGRGNQLDKVRVVARFAFGTREPTVVGRPVHPSLTFGLR